MGIEMTSGSGTSVRQRSAVPDNNHPCPSPPNGQVRSGTPVRVMIVEDDALVALGVQLTLSDLGYQVVGIAASESEALDLARAMSPHLALMDIRLRGARDGLDTALRLRTELGIRCLFLSAYADDVTMARVSSLTPLGFVQKPYAASQLRLALDLACEKLAAGHHHPMEIPA